MLAHVDARGLAASCYDPSWIAWAEERLGRASERELGDDARALTAALTTMETLAAAHALAWVWTSEADVSAATGRDLSSLADTDVADALALATARSVGPAAEVLRAAAELELPRLATMAATYTDAAALETDLAEVALAAPELGRARVSLARPLPRRGRAWRGSIFVGAPGVAGAEVARVAWQAAHEATVLEVARSASWLAKQPRGFEAVERTALGLMRSRARRAGLADPHGRWLATLDLRAIGPVLDVDDAPT